MAIINNNVGNVKFLRNGSVFESHEVAYAALTGFTLTAEQDGTAILARYTATDGNVKTLVGWVYKDSETQYITIQDIEGASSDIMALLGGGVTTANTVTDQLEALSGTTGASSAETSVEGAKAYATDYTDEQIGNLEYTGVTTGNGVVITNVIEADGVVDATSANVGGLELTGYQKGSDSGAVASTDSINDAFSKVENQIDAVNDVIEALDYTDTAVTKQFVAAVDETDGVISITRGEIESSGKTIVLTADGNDVNFEVNIDNDTLQKDENGVISVTSSALVQYEGDDDTIQIGAVSEGVRIVSSPLTIQKVTTGLSEEVKEEYRLVGASGTTIGDPVKIYKDSHIVSINYINDPADEHYQNLEYVYVNDSGATSTTYVDMSELVLEAEFASGLTIENHVARGVVDPQSELDSNDVAFLTVGADGFKISGIKDEIAASIDAIVEDLDADVSGNSIHVTVGVEEVDGVITAVTVSEDNIANADDLAELSGKTVTALTSTNGSITATPDDSTGSVTYDIETDASKIKMSGFTADASGFTAITEDSTITEAVEAIETAFIENEEVIAQSLNDLNTRVETISGDVETISGNVNTISGDVNTLKTNYISGVSVNNVAITNANNVAPISIVASGATAQNPTNAIVVDTNSTTGEITLGLNYIDCGTY